MAIKVPNKKLTPEQTDEFKAEIRIMSKLFNPRIALFMGAYIPEQGALVAVGGHSVSLLTCATQTTSPW